MARFSDMRQSIIKGHPMDTPKLVAMLDATPQRLSAYEIVNGHRQPRKGVDERDLFRSVHNRASRRASRKPFGRNRLRGNVPPHPLKIVLTSRKLEREVEMRKRREFYAMLKTQRMQAV